MTKLLFSFALASSLAFAQYKIEPAGPPPSELAPAVSSLLQQQGEKVIAPSGSVFCEVWFPKVAPSGAKSTEQNQSFPTIPLSSFMGVIQFPEKGADRRGQQIQPGVYTLRYNLFPVDGNHQGVAPQRDFLLMVPAADDKDPKVNPSFKQLMVMSRKASGTPHPAVLSMETPLDGTKFPSMTKEGDSDWVLNEKVGDLPVSLIVVGTVQQ